MTKRPQKHNAPAAALGVLTGALILGGIFFAGNSVLNHKKNPANTIAEAETTASAAATTTTTSAAATTTTTTTTARFPLAATRTAETVTVDDTELVFARNCILLECGGGDTANVLAERSADAKIPPASLTKIMSMLTFFDLCGEDVFEDTIEMDGDAIQAARAELAYVAGFTAGETCKIKDLLYAMMLPSGADAALMLATYASGSEEAFVSEMNRLAGEMGLTGTHFVNCVGLHDDDHYSTAADLSRMMRCALRSDVCRKLMSTREYTTSETEEHPDGIYLQSTTLWRMNGDELESLSRPLHIIGGKTGFTNPAGQCLATWAEDAQGNRWICVVCGSTAQHSMDAVSDTLTLYQLTDKPLDEIARYVLDEDDILDPPPHF